MSAPDRFAALVEDLSSRPGVTPPSGRAQFGGSALKVDGSIFAMLHRDQLVVKLAAERVAELIAGGSGTAFHGGRGRPMRQWLVVADESTWADLAEEALESARPSPTTLTDSRPAANVDPP